MIRRAIPTDFDAWAAHGYRLAGESGVDGDPVFMPWGREHPYDPERSRAKRTRDWTEATHGWAWLLWDGDRVVGHVDLHKEGLPASEHRVELGMGLERAFRRRGFGRQLLETAVAWARCAPGIDWIDLGVFSGNEAAIRLYESAGFERVGVTRDRFRVDGQRIDDIAMCLFVGTPRN